MTRKTIATALATAALVALFVTLRHDSSQVSQVTDASARQHKTKPPGAVPPAKMNPERRPHADPADSVPDARTRASKSLWIDELRSGPLGDVIHRHWPAAKRGDGDSMVIVYAIMTNCLPYRKRFEGKDIADVRAQFAESHDQELIALNESIWLNCADIYASWGRFAGWRTMLSEAARSGQPYAMVEVGWSNLAQPGKFSEGMALITTALQSGDPVAMTTMADIYQAAGAEPGISYAWLLAACDLGLDCSPDGAFMKHACGPFSQVCGINESVRDLIMREHGDYGLWLAERKAKDILDAVSTGGIADLDIQADLRPLQRKPE